MQPLAAPDIISHTVLPELSRIVRLDDITATANTMMLEANVRECMALAVRFDLVYLRSFSAELTFRRVRSGTMIRIDGRMIATYGQTCGMTLTSMPMVMEESFQSEYTLSAWEKYSEFDLDQPEILTDDFIDMGEVAAQYFALAIDPYACRPGGETLPELAQYLSEAVQELLTENAAPAAEVAIPPAANDSANAPEPETTSELEAVEWLTIAPEPTPTEILETAIAAEPNAEEEFITADVLIDAAEEPTTPEPDLNPQPAEEPEYESLFMKYLRKLQAA